MESFQLSFFLEYVTFFLSHPFVIVQKRPAHGVNWDANHLNFARLTQNSISQILCFGCIISFLSSKAFVWIRVKVSMLQILNMVFQYLLRFLSLGNLAGKLNNIYCFLPSMSQRETSAFLCILFVWLVGCFVDLVSQFGLSWLDFLGGKYEFPH